MCKKVCKGILAIATIAGLGVGAKMLYDKKKKDDKFFDEEDKDLFDDDGKDTFFEDEEEEIPVPEETDKDKAK